MKVPCYFWLSLSLSPLIACDAAQTNSANDEASPDVITIHHRATSFAAIRWDEGPWIRLEEGAYDFGTFEIPIAGQRFDYVDLFARPDTGRNWLWVIQATAEDFKTWDLDHGGKAAERSDITTAVANLAGNEAWVYTAPYFNGHTNHGASQATVTHRASRALNDVLVYDFFTETSVRNLLSVKILHDVDFRQVSSLDVDMSDASPAEEFPIEIEGVPNGWGFVNPKWKVLTANGTRGYAIYNRYFRFPTTTGDRNLITAGLDSEEEDYRWEILADHQFSTDAAFDSVPLADLVAQTTTMSTQMRITPNSRGMVTGLEAPQCGDLAVAYYRASMASNRASVDTVMTPARLGSDTTIEHIDFHSIPGFPSEFGPQQGMSYQAFVTARCMPPTPVADPNDTYHQDFQTVREPGWLAMTVFHHFGVLAW